MRDLETVESALKIAETGHLTFGTLHTNSAAQTINRIIDIFPADQQAQIRTQLSLVLEGIVCQALLPRADGKGRVVSLEIMVPTPAIRNLIRDDKIHQIYGAMQTGQEKLGMQTANQSLASLYMKRLITLETAMTALVEQGRAAGHDQSRRRRRRRRRDWAARRGRPAAGVARQLEASEVGVRSRSEREGSIMPNFAYTGRTRAGQTVSGERAADSMDAAIAALRREQIQVTRITPAKAEGRGEEKAEKAGKIGKKVNAKNLAVFTRQFSVMIDAGLPLVQCLDILGTQEEDKNFAAVILETRTDVESGASLADAMRKHPKTFDPLFTNMIAAGEAGGILDTILKRLATYIEKAVKLAGQVKSAMIYPIAVDRDRQRRGRRHSVEGDPDLRRAVLRPRRRAAAADAGRHRPQQQPGEVLPGPVRRRRRLGVGLQARTTRTDKGRRVDRRVAAEDADARQHPAEDRGGTLLPDAVDADQLGRADSRRPRNHREDGRQLDRRGRHHGDPQEHRARRDDRGAAEGDQGASRRW